MHVSPSNRLGPAAAVLAAVLLCPAVPSAWAGGTGHGSVMLRRGGAMPAWNGAPRPPVGAMAARPGLRGLPPVSGIIHERPGMRPYLSHYGHTNTAAGFAGYGRLALGGYGHVGTGIVGYGRGDAARGGFAAGGYGHTATGLRGVASARPGFARFGRNRVLPERVRLARAGGRFLGGGYLGGRFLGGYGGVGLGYGDAAGGGLLYGGGAGYGGDAGYGGGASYGADGTYGGSSTDTQVGSYGGTYRSETPLAASFAEPPLAPSPGSGYDTANRYAYAASDDVSYGARIVSVNRAARRDCDCGPRLHPSPTIYRYGVGTAY